MAYPKILSLKPIELVDWCNSRRKEMGISKAKLADLTNVPESTLDRIFSGKNPEFRYSTIQPIVTVLLDYYEDIPAPDSEDEAQSEYYYKTIEGYKLVVENKNHIINEAKFAYKKLEDELKYMRDENAIKDSMIKTLQEHLAWMQHLVDSKA